MRTIYCLLLILCIYSKLFCQEKDMAVVGMQVTNVAFTHVLNYKTSHSNLKAFSKKIVLIDFWTTTCGACLKKMPVLDSMQKVYANDLSVLLVSSSQSDTKEKVYKAFSRIKENDGYQVGLPVILGDSLLKQQLPHIYVPHFAILDSNLKLLAVTDGDELTAARLAEIVRTGQAGFGVENKLRKLHPNDVLFNEDAKPVKGIMLQYTMSRYDSQLPWSSYITKDSNGLVTKMLLTNNSVGELLERAYHYFDYPGIVLWPAGVPAPPNPADITPEWKKANCYTYQLICEPMPYDSARRLLQQELQRLFGYTATVGYSRATRYVLKTREGFNNGPPLTAMDAAQSADVLQITRYLSRKYRIELDCKLPLSLCTNINMQALTGKDLAGCEALLNQQEFYFTREQVEKRALFIHHPSN